MIGPVISASPGAPSDLGWVRPAQATRAAGYYCASAGEKKRRELACAEQRSAAILQAATIADSHGQPEVAEEIRAMLGCSPPWSFTHVMWQEGMTPGIHGERVEYMAQMIVIATKKEGAPVLIVKHGKDTIELRPRRPSGVGRIGARRNGWTLRTIQTRGIRQKGRMKKLGQLAQGRALKNPIVRNWILAAAADFLDDGLPAYTYKGIAYNFNKSHFAKRSNLRVREAFVSAWIKRNFPQLSEKRREAYRQKGSSPDRLRRPNRLAARARAKLRLEQLRTLWDERRKLRATGALPPPEIPG